MYRINNTDAKYVISVLDGLADVVMEQRCKAMDEYPWVRIGRSIDRAIRLMTGADIDNIQIVRDVRRKARKVGIKRVGRKATIRSK